jgi:sugar phosphate permease
MEAQRTRPSIGRWYILFLISLMYLITYLDRVNISTVAPVISKEFDFDKVTMGIIFSAFVWAYALFQVPGGWLNDRFGPRRVLAIIVGVLPPQPRSWSLSYTEWIGRRGNEVLGRVR